MNGKLHCAKYSLVLLTFVLFCVLNFNHACCEEALFINAVTPPRNKNAKADLLYLNKDHNVVMQYDIGVTKDDKLYFRDRQHDLLLNRQDSWRLANVPFELSRYVTKHELVPMNNVGTNLVGIEDSLLKVVNSYSPQCEWPFPASLKITRKNQFDMEVMFFVKAKGLDIEHYNLDCEGISDDINISTKYRNIVPILYKDSDGRVYLSFRYPAIVFSYNPNGSDFKLLQEAGIVTINKSVYESLKLRVVRREISLQNAVEQVTRVMEKTP